MMMSCLVVLSSDKKVIASVTRKRRPAPAITTVIATNSLTGHLSSLSTCVLLCAILQTSVCQQQLQTMPKILSLGLSSTIRPIFDEKESNTLLTTAIIKASQTTGSPVTVINELRDLMTAAQGDHKSYAYGHGDQHKKNGHREEHGKKWGQNSHGHKGNHKNHGSKHWADHGHGSHGGHHSDHHGGKHGNYWDDHGEKEKYTKDRGHGYVKAFSWDREQGEKDKWGSKGGKYGSHYGGNKGGHWGKHGHGSSGGSAWGDAGDHAGWDDSGWGSLWGSLGGYGALGGHWANGWSG